MNPAPPVIRTRIPRTLSALSDPGLKPFVQRLDDRGGREGLDRAPVGGLAQLPHALSVGDEPTKGVGEGLRISGVDKAGRLAQSLPLGYRARRDDRAPRRRALEDLVRDHAHPLRARAED